MTRQAGLDPPYTGYAYDEAGHLVGEYDASTGAAIQETIWMGDTPIAVTKGSGTYYVHADHLNTPRQINDQAGDPVWVWDTITFGSSTPDEDPLSTGTAFTYNLRHPGQVFDAESGLLQNWYRDYSPGLGRYVQSDPVGLLEGINTYAYVDGNPLIFFDPNGLGKEGGRTSVAGNDPLIPKDMRKNTSREEVMKQVRKIEEEMRRNPDMSPARKNSLRAWIKVAKRGFTKSICPPFIEDFTLNILADQCSAGDLSACSAYLSMGGEISESLY